MELERIKPYEAKRALTSILNKVAYGKTPIVFESRGKDLAALIPMEQLYLLERVIEKLADQFDLEEAEKALFDSENSERISWSALKDELGL